MTSMTVFRSVFDYPGANPPGPEHMSFTECGMIVVRPFSETHEASYRFRLDLRIEVVHGPAEAVLTIDWHDDTYRHLRRTLYVAQLKQAALWNPVRAEGHGCSGPLTFRLHLEDGLHHVTLNPKFDGHDLEVLIEECSQADFIQIVHKEIPGHPSPLTAFTLRAGSSPRPVILAVARLHPYETAGSHCLAGIIRGALSNRMIREELLTNFDWLIIPIVSVPGVEKGFCRLNGARDAGIDLSRQADPHDPLSRALLELVKDVQLAGYLDIHNWMHPDRDGISFMNRFQTRRFFKLMDSRKSPVKPWRTYHRYGLLPRERSGLMSLLAQNGRTLCCALELPWHGRDVATMQRIGTDAALSFQELAGAGPWRFV